MIAYRGGRAMSDDQQDSSRWWLSGDEYRETPPTPSHPAGIPLHDSSATPSGPQLPATFVPPGQRSQLAERSFYAVVTIFGVPVFVLFCAVVARFAIPDRGGRPIGVGAAIFGGLLIIFALRVPYVAIVSSDGALTFKALTGATRTDVSRINRITVYTGGRGGSMWYFYYDGGRARLGDVGGRALARYLVELNPAIDYPHRLTRWWGSPL